MNHSIVRIVFAALASSMIVPPATAASFNLASGTTAAAQTLGTGAGQTGVVALGATLSVSGATVAVTISGNTATLTNLGSILQSGTGRAIRDNTGVTGLVITNGSLTNSTALMQAADADVIQMNKTPAGVTLNNYGTMTSLNASAGGSQAVDFTAVLSGGNTINNYATGIMQASEADAVRPGVNGVVFNAGTMKSTTSTGSSSDGIDMQNNSGGQITNDTTGLVEGARHGITGAALDNTVTFIASITNNAGGIIKGDNGSGLNFDGFNSKQTVTVVNQGTITGNGITGDGDGVDVDGIVNLTNTGIIRSINAFSAVAGTPAQSEGITVGGGTIVNSGTIEGLVAAGNTNAVGRGISLLGNDSLVLPGTREAIYGDAAVTNQAGGLIRGQTDSAIAVDGPASGFTVTITNQAGGTIQGGGTSVAAILTGADNDTINNSGTIDGSSSGKAIDMGGGNNAVHISGGVASIIGSISGGVGGANVVTINPGSGNSFSYAGSISNFSSVSVQSGTVTLSGTNSYTGDTAIDGGTLDLASPGMITSHVVVKSGAAMIHSGVIGGTGTGVTVQNGGSYFVTAAGTTGLAAFGGAGQYLDLQSGSSTYFDIGGTTRGTGYDYLGGLSSFTLPTTGNAAHFFLNYLGSYSPAAGDTFALVDWGAIALGAGSLFDFSAAPSGFAWDTSRFLTSGEIMLSPEPGRGLLLLTGLIGIMTRRRRTVPGPAL